MWLKIHKQSERESYSHKKHGKVTMAEGTNPTTTKKAQYFVLFVFFGSYRVTILYHCSFCALSGAITFPFTLLVIIKYFIMSQSFFLCPTFTLHLIMA